MNLKLIEDSARIVSAFVPSNAKQEIQTLIIHAIDESKLKTDEMAISLYKLAGDINDIRAMLAAIQASLPGNAATVPYAPEEVNDSPDEVIVKVDDNV